MLIHVILVSLVLSKKFIKAHDSLIILIFNDSSSHISSNLLIFNYMKRIFVQSRVKAFLRYWQYFFTVTV